MTAPSRAHWRTHGCSRRSTDKPALPRSAASQLSAGRALRYGENPHQAAALYTDGSGTGVAGAKQLQGKELSYNNLVDLDACWDLAQEFTEPMVAIIKHTNPCGAATGANVLEAYTRALSTDPVSAFGSVIGVNREIDEAAAEEIAKLFVEAIAAPAFTGSARPLLRQEEPAAGGRQSGGAHAGYEAGLRRYAAAGCRHRHGQANDLHTVTKRPPTPRAAGPALCLEGGQACEIERHRLCAGRPDDRRRRGTDESGGCGAFWRDEGGSAPRGTVAASDAFFPFPDGLETIVEAGATAVIQPGGSVRDDAVIEAADRLGIAMVFTGIRHFRH